MLRFYTALLLLRWLKANRLFRLKRFCLFRLAIVAWFFSLRLLLVLFYQFIETLLVILVLDLKVFARLLCIWGQA